MAPNSYSILALGKARSSWLGELSAWTTSGVIPARVIKCLSTAEVRQRLSSLQPSSALIVDSEFLQLDPHLIGLARASSVATFVVPGRFVPSTASEATVLFEGELTPPALMSALAAHATLMPTAAISDMVAAVEQASSWAGSFVAVCGPGGTGSSTLAMALAQGLGRREVDAGLVALVDMTRNSELAMLHDASETGGSLEDLVECHRTRRAASDEVRSLAAAVPTRGYSLIRGTRKSSAWAALPPKAITSALDGLRRSFRFVVADITADFEGEAQSGSTDIEERNHLARSSAMCADVVVVVGTHGMKGTHSLARTVRELIDLGVAAERILPVVNRGPKGTLAKTELTKALSSLVHHKGLDVATTNPIFLPDRKVEADLRDGTGLDKRLVEPLTRAVTAVIARRPVVTEGSETAAIVPGTLGTHAWAVGE